MGTPVDVVVVVDVLSGEILFINPVSFTRSVNVEKYT